MHAVGQAQAFGHLFADDLVRVIAEHDVDLVLARVEVVEQALGVERTAGSGDGDENFHGRAKYAAGRTRSQARQAGTLAARSPPVACWRGMMSDFENEVPPVLESKPTPPPGTSLLARLLNVLAMPGQVFEEVRPARHAAGNWLVPVPLYAARTCIYLPLIHCSS